MITFTVELSKRPPLQPQFRCTPKITAPIIEMVSTLAMTDALAKLLIAKGIITDEEFKAQLGERENYVLC